MDRASIDVSGGDSATASTGTATVRLGRDPGIQRAVGIFAATQPRNGGFRS